MNRYHKSRQFLYYKSLKLFLLLQIKTAIDRRIAEWTRTCLFATSSWKWLLWLQAARISTCSGDVWMFWTWNAFSQQQDFKKSACLVRHMHDRVELQIEVNLFRRITSIGKCYYAMPNGKLFVGGSIHQGADRISNASRGRQCACMSLSALLCKRSLYPCHGGQQAKDEIFIEVETKLLNNKLYQFLKHYRLLKYTRSSLPAAAAESNQSLIEAKKLKQKCIVKHK